MRTWARVPIESVCGLCGHRIARGEPALAITIRGLNAQRLRCAACGGGAPADLPPPIDHQVPIAAMAHSRVERAPRLPLDFKSRAAEREPGCDDE